VTSERLRLEAYRRLAGAQTDEEIEAVREELTDRYGALPEPALNLLAVASFRIVARRYGLTEVAAAGPNIRFSPLVLRESQTLRLQRLYKGSVTKPAAELVLVPKPLTGGVGSAPLRDSEVLAWCTQLLEAVAGDSIAAAHAVMGS
jgi:transcription-repair coupling factor (superfamily II helicase)